MMILDTHGEVFIWIGQCVESKEKQKAFDIGQVSTEALTLFSIGLLFLLYSLYVCPLPPEIHRACKFN
jgi:hypothetical protein